MSSARRSAEKLRLRAEGADDFRAGKRRTQSPYRQGSSDDRDWRDGWDMADDDERSRRSDDATASKYGLAERARSATSIEDLGEILAQVIEALPDDFFNGT